MSASTLLSSSGTAALHTASVVAIDLESNSQVAGRFLGHSNYVTDINLTVGDANTFVTASADGFVRMFDKRHPLPVVTIDTMQHQHASNAALSITPDGIPLMITDRTQSIKVWDLRARSMLYELATGNDTVISMAWDDRNSTLYASLECEYLSPNGYNIEYRRYRDPVPQTKKAEVIEEKDDEDDEDEEEDEEMEEEEFDDRYADPSVDPTYTGRCWPKRAAHGEGFWEETYDAARHGIAAFHFKEQPDTGLYACDGDATMEH